MTPFPTTRWNLIADAVDRNSPGSEPALSGLCESYWYPVYGLIRSRGFAPDEAADLAQDFFARLLDGKLLAAADRSKGRFRDLLWRDCTFFLADARDRASARKRCPDKAVVSLEVAAAEARYGLEPPDRLDPKDQFDRAWALEVIEGALDRLRAQEEQAGRGPGFRELSPLLTEDCQAASPAAVAARIGVTEGAVRAALHRLRLRYREALRHEVACTLDVPTEANIDEEIRYLFEALGR